MIKDSVNNHVDHVYVMTVRKFEDRIAHIEKEMSCHNIKFTFYYEDFTPNLEKDLKTKITKEFTLPRAYQAYVLQHIAMWREAIKKGYKRILVFEDDVILHKKFTKHFCSLFPCINQLEKDYIVFLGGSDTRVPDDFFLKNDPLYPLPIATSEGLIMDIEGIKRRLKWVDKNGVPLGIDHLIAHIDRTQKAKSYWSRIPITKQASITGALRTKVDKNRLKHSELYNLLRYHWMKFQRRQLRHYIVNAKYLIIHLAK